MKKGIVISTMIAGVFVSIISVAEPIGSFPEYIKFCSRYSDQCVNDSNVSVLVYSDDLINLLNRVNIDINKRIRPDNNKDGYHWSLETLSGNCNDYVVQKRAVLHDYGISFNNLLMVAVYTSSGIGHMVLVVRTDRGNFVLDNLRNRIVLFKDSGYTLIRMQSVSDINLWER